MIARLGFGRTLVAAVVKATENGDWRAGLALIGRVHGKPTERVETMNKPFEDLTPDELDAELSRLLAEHHEDTSQ